MPRSPGHQQHPEHKVTETPMHQRIRVTVDGEVIADSWDVIKLEEDGYRPRYYFNPSDVSMERMLPSMTTSECPFKGKAHYFSLQLPDRKLDDAAWSYPEPYEEHQTLQDRIAFYDDNFPEMNIRLGE